MNPKSRALFETTVIYVILAFVGWLTFENFKIEDESIWRFLYADLAMTVACYIISVFKKNTSVYDAYWSVIPFYFLVAWCAHYNGDTWGIEQWLAAAVISFWSWRLTLSWARGFPGWHHEDYRYVNFRSQFGKFFEPMNFLALQLYPTVIVFLGMLGLFWVFEMGTLQNALLFYLGAFVTLLGGIFELLADNELAKFRHRPNPKKEDILRTGIWGYSRNPNYLGELLFWFGILAMSIAYAAPWYAAIGFVGMLAMFLFASIPMKDKQMMKNRPEAFAQYKKEVSMLIPMPPRKSKEKQ